MNTKLVVGELREKYPQAEIVKNDEHHPTEIICEVKPATDHPEYSLAVAVIDKSAPHVHQQSQETYKVIKGKLTLIIDDQKHELKVGEEIVIEPGQVHWAAGDETWVKCYSQPGWKLADHILK